MENRPQRLSRVLRLPDVSLFLIAALVNLNSVPVVAGAGPAAIGFWVVGFFLFFIPQGIAVLELTHRSPAEGGIYNWTKESFGQFHGFISGWFYWTNNIFYVPTLLFYIVGFGAFIGGEGTRGLSSDALMMTTVSLGLLWIITALNIAGMQVGKWIQNVGATGTFLTTALILVIGFISLNVRGPVNDLSFTSFIPNFGNWHVAALLSVVCLNYVGLELASVMGDEIQEPRKTVPRAALIAGSATVLVYVLATFALQATVPAAEIGVIDGILQAVEKAAGEIGMLWIVVPIALLMTFNAAGNTSAWLSGSSRIPFVIGIDRYLPASFGKIHARFKTPHIALLVQGAASSVCILISAAGSSVSDMYMILLQTTVVLQLIPYLYMFASLVKVSAAKDKGERYFTRRSIPFAAGIMGFIMTTVGIAFAFVPTAAVTDAFSFQLKTFIGTVSFLIPALIIHRVHALRLRAQSAVTETAHVS